MVYKVKLVKFISKLDMERVIKVVVFIFIEFKDYNGFIKRLCIYNYNGIVYKVNIND